MQWNSKKNSGFIAPIITDQNFVLGSSLALPTEPINHAGDWTAYLPIEERQDIFIETFNCTSFSCLNCFEILFRYFYADVENFSDRYLGIMAGTKPPGNDPNTVAQAVRHSGLVSETLLPFGNVISWQEYYSFKDSNEKTCKTEGQKFLNKWIPGHEYVFTGKMNKTKMREALKYSPLQISVCAWFKNDKGEYYSPKDMDNNHATVCYKIDDKGQVYVFDSYEPHYKLLTADHNIQFCKRYNVSLVEENLKQQVSLLTQVLSLLKKIYANIYKVGGEIIGAVFQKRQD